MLIHSNEIKNTANSQTFWEIQNFIQARAINVVVGSSNVGKTFNMLNWAYRIASKHDLRGFNASGSPVAYMCAEGFESINSRKQPLDSMFPNAEIYFSKVLIDLRDTNQLLRLSKTCLERGVKCVVFDTLTASLPSASKNDDGTASQVMFNLRHFFTNRGMTVVLVAHTGKDTSKGIAGSHVWEADASVVISVQKNKIKLVKNRNGHKHEFSWDLIVSDEGIYAEYSDNRTLTQRQQTVLMHIEKAFREGADIDVSNIKRSYLTEHYEVLNGNNERNKFDRDLKSLVEHEYVYVRELQGSKLLELPN